MGALHGLTAAGIGHPEVRRFLAIKRGRVNSAEHVRPLALEGLWAVRHAVVAGVPLETVFVCAARLRGDEGVAVLAQLRRSGALALEVSDRVLLRMVERDGPDGIAAIAALPSPGLSDITIDATTRVVIADSFELAGNLGTLIRCADGAGAAGVVVTNGHVRLDHPLVVKASMATLLSVPVVETYRERAMAWTRSSGMRVVAADPAATVSYRDADYRGPVALVLGSERSGLSGFWRAAADACVSIPMLGTADSLNVGHAAALVLYEALHQHRADPG